MITKSLTLSGATVTNTGTGTATSEKLDTDFRNVTLQCLITETSGTTAGTFKAQGSSDGANWSDIASATATVTDVATQTLSISMTDKIYPYYRINYTGTGTMVAVMSAAYITLGK